MLTSLRGTVDGNTVVFDDGERLNKYDGTEVIITFLGSPFIGTSDNATPDNKKNQYPKSFWNLFGSDKDTGFEVPDELTFDMDSPRESL